MPSYLVFKDAEVARDNICATDQKKIRQLYEDWAAEVGERAKYYASKTTASSYWQEQQLLELQRQLTEQSKVIANQIYSNTKESMYKVADSVVGCNAKFLADLGFPADGINAAFTSVPTHVVNNLITGQIYEGGWNLSSAIWGDNQQTLSDIYGIVARGRAENLSVYDISKALEAYVNPNKAKQWNLKMPDGVKIYKKSVDYNAQRLVRTLTQHAYQQGVIQSAKANPFIQLIIWRSNGSRTCELCLDRDGHEYKPDELPMDHPNGMCTMEPKINMDATINQLADWFNSPDGTYPEIDEFALAVGYAPSAPQPWNQTQSKWLSMAGYKEGEMPKDFTEFAYKLSFDDQAELLKEAGGSWSDSHPYQVMEKYFNQNIAVSGGKQTIVQATKQAADISSLGTSKGKTFNYWYTKLDDAQKALAKDLKDASGLTWQQWYEQNIKVGGATAKKAATAMPTVQAPGQPVDVASWINGVRRNTEADMLASESASFARMTAEQQAGIRKYTGSAYTEMNEYLRTAATGPANPFEFMSGDRVQAMQDAIAGLSGASTTQELYLRRGTDLGDLAGLMPGDFFSNKAMLENMSVDELRAKFVGYTGEYAGFTSTSSLWDRGFSGDVEVVFHAPAGTAGSSVMSISRFGTGEGEFLLNAGTRVQVVDVQQSDGHEGSSIRVFMEILKK